MVRKTLPRIDGSLSDGSRGVEDLHQYLIEHLSPFLPFLEQRFCHGDLHPGNILWQDDRIRAIIDWENAGMREELYDLALIIGCVGMDDPLELTGE